MYNKKEYFITKPKDAASLIIIRNYKKNIYILMGKRPNTSRFMPGVYVFPGGGLEKIDFSCRKYFKINIKPHRNKLKTRDESHALALFYTAVRETYEETGLYLSRKANKNFNSSILKGLFKYNYDRYSLIPDISKLIFFGRAITPSIIKKRFHARFFISYYENFNGVLRTNGELEDLKWVELKEAKKKKIADVTEFMIEQLINLKENSNLIVKNYAYPMFTWRKKKKWVKWENFD